MISLPKKLTLFLPAFVRLDLGFDFGMEDLFFFFCLSRPILIVFVRLVGGFQRLGQQQVHVLPDLTGPAAVKK